jgi:hypothetical protein
MIRLIDLLREVGEGTAKPYEYKHSRSVYGNIYFTFKTDPNPNRSFLGEPDEGTEYEVNLSFWDAETEKPSESNIDISFSTKYGDYEEETNDNMQYRVMATVIAIAKEILPKHPEVTTLTFTPSKANKMDTRRARLYKAYIEKQLPGKTVREVGKYGGYKIEL